ncbi:MAG: GTPase Era [Saprospiraceae bacterium]|nr:GTPase Era [Saprospiraceae bacterium]
MVHRSGFVNIIGRPNVGKSTLMNALVGERMSIITNKPQTTRHRIIGILSGEDFQIVFSDTPGMIKKPSYKMQEAMNKFVLSTFEDADLFLFVTDPNERYGEEDPFLEKLKQAPAPLFICLNKVDLLTQEVVVDHIKFWEENFPNASIFPISALEKIGTEGMLEKILEQLPEGPEYYPKDQLTDRPERFFVTEIIREKILELYREEIPYSCEVKIESFKEGKTSRDEPIVRISALIFVGRKSQKNILIGHQGSAIKKLGTLSRKSIEKWLETKVHLELFVKVRDNWRDDERSLSGFGYQS